MPAELGVDVEDVTLGAGSTSRTRVVAGGAGAGCAVGSSAGSPGETGAVFVAATGVGVTAGALAAVGVTERPARESDRAGSEEIPAGDPPEAGRAVPGG